MFSLRGRLSAKQAQSRFLDLANHHYQWSLRTPIYNLLARGDLVGFVCVLSLLVDEIGQGLYLLNRRNPPTPWRQTLFSPLTSGDAPDSSLWLDADHAGWLCPDRFAERLQFVLSLDDCQASLAQALGLTQDLLDLFFEQDKKIKADAIFWLGEQPAVRPGDWPEFDLGQATNLARRAVRIVWRLPGGRMAAITGSLAAGWADPTSDIDLVVYCDHLSAEPVRRSLIGATSDSAVDITQKTEKCCARDRFWLDGCLIDVHYVLVKDLERLVACPLPDSFLDKCILAQLEALDPLYDPTLLQVNLLDPRDRQRALNRVQSARVAAAWAQLNQTLARLDVARSAGSVLYATTHVIVGLLDLLAARNNRWLAFPRWTANWLRGLDRAPVAMQERLLDVLAAPFYPEAAGNKFQALQTLAVEAAGDL